MQFISVRQMRQNSAELWKQLREEAEIILTSNGKPIAVMAGVDEKNVEKFISPFVKRKPRLPWRRCIRHRLKPALIK